MRGAHPPPPAVVGSLVLRRGLLVFEDPGDEAAYAQYRWARARRVVAGSVAAVTALFCAVSFEYDLTDYRAQPLYLLILFLGRVAPLAALAALCCAPPARAWRLWSPLACACTFLLALSVYLQQFLCAHTGAPGGASAQCALFAAGLLPWLPLVVVATAPLVMATGLQARWHDVTLWGALSLGAFVGLLLAVQTRDFIATPIVLGLAFLGMATASSYDRDLALRDAFRHDAASGRKLASAATGSLTRAAAHEGHQRLEELLKRLDVMASEVSPEGVLQWCSPGARRVLAVDPEDVLRTDTFRYVHADDAPALREALARLVSSGAAVAALSAPAPLGARPPSVPWQRLPPETLLFTRLQFRRRRADGTSGHVWVEAELWPVIRRASLLPGVAAPQPAGVTTVLMVERDITWERRQAQQAGLSVATAAGAQLPVALNALALVQPPEARDREWALRQGEAAALGAAPQRLFDPFFERSLYSAVAVLAVPLAAAHVAAMSALSLVMTASESLRSHAAAAIVEQARGGGGAAAAAAAAAAPLLLLAPADGPHDHHTARGDGTQGGLLSAAMEAGIALGAASRVLRSSGHDVHLAQQLVAEAVGVARHRCQFLPLRTLEPVNPRELVAAAVEVAQQRQLLSVMAALRRRQSAAAAAAAAVAAASAPSPQLDDATLLEAEGPQEIEFLRPELLPAVVLVDRAKMEAVLHVAFAIATAAVTQELPLEDTAGIERPPIAVRAEGRSTPTLGQPALLRLQLRVVIMFDAARIGGTDGLGAALSVDPLTASDMACPVPPGSVEPSHTGAPLGGMCASPRVLLPLLRHLALCMGGHVTSGAASNVALLGDGAVGALLAAVRAAGCESASLPTLSVLVVDLPSESPTRPLEAGPTVVDHALVRSRIAECPPFAPPREAAVPPPTPQPPPLLHSLALMPDSAVRKASAVEGGGGGSLVDSAAGSEAPSHVVTAARRPGQPPPLAAAPLRAAVAAPPPVVAAPAVVAPATPEPLGFNVLFVDDEHVNRRLGGRMLQRLGCTYTLVEDGEQVAPALGSAPVAFDAILMDIVMQQTDGAEVCRDLRDAGYILPIIAMTGNTEPRDVQRYMAAGFDLVLPKPFDMKAMARALLEGRRIRRTRVDSERGLAPLLQQPASEHAAPRLDGAATTSGGAQ